MKGIFEELEGMEALGAGRRIFGWGLAGVVLGLGVAAVAKVFESYFEWDGSWAGDEPESEKKSKPGPSKAKPAPRKKAQRARTRTRKETSDRAFQEYLGDLQGPLRELADGLDAELLGLGDDTERAVLKRYVAYKRAGANFACTAVRRSADEVLVYLRLDPTAAGDLLPFMRDVTEVGHVGTGDLELRLADLSQLAAARDFLARSYAAV